LTDANTPIVTSEDIAEVVSMWTGVPVTQLSQAETERLLKMEETLHGRIVGQEDAITIVSKVVRRARAGVVHLYNVRCGAVHRRRYDT